MLTSPTRRRGMAAVVVALEMLVAGCTSGPTAGPTADPSSATIPSSVTPTPATTPSASAPSSASSAPTPSASRSSASASATRAPTTSCGGLSLTEQVGQLFVMGVTATGLSSAELKTLGDREVGGVIMMGNTRASADDVRRLTDGVRAAGKQPDGVTVLVSVDQEGGQVRRLQGSGFTAMPSAATQAGWSDSELTTRAMRWGTELKGAGVDLDLAPVADVVPTSVGAANRPIGALGRGYGSNPLVVGAKVSAFVKGMHAGKEATAVKHFPGLGRVKGNTDFAAKVVDSATTRDDPLLAGFDAAQTAGVDMIMVSTAYYTKIDADHPAAFSSTVITGMLRQDRKYDGVVVSDDLGVAKAVTAFTPGDRAITFLQAGGDVVINVDPSSVDDMVIAVLAKAKADPAFAKRVAQSAERVLQLKSRHGLARCS